MTAPRLQLVSHALCPYVQRVAVALAEKDVACERITIDLDDPPPWFAEISPLRKVPLLRVGSDAVLFESAAILEYLEDTLPLPLHPRDPLERARHRAWIEFGSAVLADIWRVFTAPDAASFAAAQAALRTKFERVEADLDERGPWFAGPRFTLVDVAFGPVFNHWRVFDAIVGLRFDGLKKVGAWRTALVQRASVRDAVAGDYASLLAAHIRKQRGHLATLLPAWK